MIANISQPDPAKKSCLHRLGYDERTSTMSTLCVNRFINVGYFSSEDDERIVKPPGCGPTSNILNAFCHARGTGILTDLRLRVTFALSSL